MDKKVELQVLNISNSQAQVGAYAMVLGEVDGERQLPIIIGPAEAQATAICLKGIKAPRPLTHDLFYSCLNVLGATLLWPSGQIVLSLYSNLFLNASVYG